MPYSSGASGRAETTEEGAHTRRAPAPCPAPVPRPRLRRHHGGRHRRGRRRLPQHVLPLLPEQGGRRPVRRRRPADGRGLRRATGRHAPPRRVAHRPAYRVQPVEPGEAGARGGAHGSGAPGARAGRGGARARRHVGRRRRDRDRRKPRSRPRRAGRAAVRRGRRGSPVGGAVARRPRAGAQLRRHPRRRPGPARGRHPARRPPPSRTLDGPTSADDPFPRSVERAPERGRCGSHDADGAGQCRQCGLDGPHGARPGRQQTGQARRGAPWRQRLTRRVGVSSGRRSASAGWCRSTARPTTARAA